VRAMYFGTSFFLIAVGAVLYFAVTATVAGIDIQTVGLILMIAGGAGLALSLLYEVVRDGNKDKPIPRDESPPRSGYDDPTRRMR
jgi:hypothetical protein